MSDYISRQAAIDALEKEKPTPFVNKDGSIDPFGAGRQNQWYRDGIAIMNLPSAQPDDWMERNKERILQAGMEGREIEFRIGGRLFAIREKAQ